MYLFIVFSAQFKNKIFHPHDITVTNTTFVNVNYVISPISFLIFPSVFYNAVIKSYTYNA
jgi:hypothetical protein